MNIHAHVHSEVCGGQKRVLDPLELETQTSVDCHVTPGN